MPQKGNIPAADRRTPAQATRVRNEVKQLKALVLNRIEVEKELLAWREDEFAEWLIAHDKFGMTYAEIGKAVDKAEITIKKEIARQRKLHA